MSRKQSSSVDSIQPACASCVQTCRDKIVRTETEVHKLLIRPFERFAISTKMSKEISLELCGGMPPATLKLWAHHPTVRNNKAYMLKKGCCPLARLCCIQMTLFPCALQSFETTSRNILTPELLRRRGKRSHCLCMSLARMGIPHFLKDLNSPAKRGV